MSNLDVLKLITNAKEGEGEADWLLNEINKCDCSRDIDGLIKTFKEGGGDLERRNAIEETALTMVCRRGDFQKMESLIQGGANVNASGGYNARTTLMVAVLSSNLKCVIGLLEAGADINLKDRDGRDALGVLLFFNSLPLKLLIDFVRELLDRGAEINTFSGDLQVTNFMLAARCQPDIVELLIRYGGDVCLCNQQGLRAEDFCEKSEVKERIVEERLRQEALLSKKMLEQGVFKNVEMEGGKELKNKVVRKI